MRSVSRALLALGAAGAAALGPAAAVHAAGSGSLTTAPAAEAWYRTAPICALPTGCPEAPSQYSPDTLHVGVNLGAEEARTFLQLDLAGLPPGTKPAGGELRLPVATGTQDGTRNPQTAKMRACLVTAAVQDVDGAFTGAPEADCEAASADAVFVAATPETPAAFTVDLAALATAWWESAAPGALALLPAEAPAPTDTWHVAFSDRTRTGDGVAKVTAAVSYVGAAVDTAKAPPAPVQAPVDPGTPATAPVDLGTPTTTTSFPDSSLASPVTGLEATVALPDINAAPPAPAAAAPTPRAAPPVAVAPVASVIDASFRYPAVFLLPLLFAVATAWLGRALTRDLTEQVAS